MVDNRDEKEQFCLHGPYGLVATYINVTNTGLKNKVQARRCCLL